MSKTMKLLVDTTDPTWREQRELTWQKYIAAIWKGDRISNWEKRDNAIMFSFYMGDAPLTFTPGETDKHAHDYDLGPFFNTLEYSPHQCAENWIYWFERLADYCREVRPITDDELYTILYNQWSQPLGFSEELNVNYFEQLVLIGSRPTIFDPLGLQFKMAPYALYRYTLYKMEHFFEGVYVATDFPLRWYEYFKALTWKVDPKEHELDYASLQPYARGNVKAPPGYWPSWRSTRTELVILLYNVYDSYWLERKVMSDGNRSVIKELYNKPGPERDRQIAAVEQLREIFKTDVASGEFPPAFCELAKWVEVAPDAIRKLLFISRGEEPYVPAHEAQAMSAADAAERQEEMQAWEVEREAELNKPLVGNKSHAKRIATCAEKIRQLAVDAGLIESGEPWDTLESYAEWYGRTEQAGDDEYWREDLRMQLAPVVELIKQKADKGVIFEKLTELILPQCFHYIEPLDERGAEPEDFEEGYAVRDNIAHLLCWQYVAKCVGRHVGGVRLRHKSTRRQWHERESRRFMVHTANNNYRYDYRLWPLQNSEDADFVQEDLHRDISEFSVNEKLPWAFHFVEDETGLVGEVNYLPNDIRALFTTRRS